MSTENEPPLKKPVQKNEALWLMSFSDMSLVLLCFFILLISIMTPDKAKFERMNEGMITEKKKGKESPKTLNEVKKEIEATIKEEKIQKNAKVKYDVDGLRIEFGNGMMFTTGSANTTRRFKATLKKVVNSIAELGPHHKVIVEGHTDDVPLTRGGRYPSNWELSAARGIAVMQDLVDLGISEHKLSVAAYAHVRPAIDPTKLKGKALQSAREKNRRVVIWVE